MLEAKVAAGIAGALMGLIASPFFSYVVEGLQSRTIRKSPLSIVIGLLGGGTIASQPIGSLITTIDILPWYVIGEGITFGFPAIVIVWRYTLR